MTGIRVTTSRVVGGLACALVLVAGARLARGAFDNQHSWGTIPYLGWLERDGTPLQGTVDLCFRLYASSDPSDVTVLWAESQASVPVVGGAFSVRLGAVTGLSSSVETATDLHLEIGVSAAGSGAACTASDTAGFTMLSGRQQLGASPYALSARQAVPGQDFVVDGRVTNRAGVQVTIPSGAVVPFDLAACPPGWTEYAPAYGRFVRGVDHSGLAQDPDGARAVGSVQADLVGSHDHAYVWMKPDNAVDGVDSATTYSGEHHNETTRTGVTGGAETRPRNVALLYCRKD
ncbi:MAG: hypothetical protein HY904_08760 [Deltaproteobacteria bacterium]|nr:hypothetical protein [Deltaproteobacteria bacterium]